MIYITGDLHGMIDGYRLEQNHFDYSGLTRDDYLIVVGDFGFVWHGTQQDQDNMAFLKELPVTILFIDGNHENFDALEQYPVEQWHAGMIHRIADNIIHLMRGQVFLIEGKRYFTFGGGTSIDKARRTEGVSWWPQEMPNMQEYETGLATLDAYEWQVDYVLTHTAPSQIIKRIAPYIGKDKLNDYLATIDMELRYTHWYFGHYHVEGDLDAKHTVLFHSFVHPGDGIKQKDISRIKQEL